MAPESWPGLPARLRRQVKQRTGPVLAAAHGEGLADLRAVLTTATGPVFIKGVRADDPRAWSLRNEAAVSPQQRPVVGGGAAEPGGLAGKRPGQFQDLFLQAGPLVVGEVPQLHARQL